MRTVLITGGFRSIGKAICERFAEGGCEIVAPSRTALALDNADSIAACVERNTCLTGQMITVDGGFSAK